LSNFKDKFFFIVEFFLPEDDKVKVDDLLIVHNPQVFNLYEYFVYPIEYSGFFSNTFFLLLKREDFLFNKPEPLFEIIKTKLKQGIKNLYFLNFKKLFFKVNPYVDNIKIDTSFLLIKYVCKFNEKEKKEFFLLIPDKFLINFIVSVLGEKFYIYSQKLEKDIVELLSYFKLRLYRDSITSYWDIGNFINELNDKNLQLLLNMLLKNNIVEETMLTGFIAGFKDSKIMQRLINNLSKNVQEDVQKNLTYIIFDNRWIEECKYLIKNGIERLIFNGLIDFPSLKYIRNLKARIKQERYSKIFQDKSFEDFLKDAYKDVIRKLLVIF